MQRADDFLSSQIYLCLIVALLLVFSTLTRKSRRNVSNSEHHKLTSGGGGSITSGKLVASQHESNQLTAASSQHHFQSTFQSAFASNSIGSGIESGNMFLVTIISAPIYSLSIVVHIYAQNSANRDLISSVTMILIAFVALIGIFLPLLLQIHRFNSLVADRLPGTLSRTQNGLQPHTSLSVNLNSHHAHHHSPSSPQSSAFTLFPEFAPTGLRRPSSASGESSIHGQQNNARRTFAQTKESRRKLGAALANLGPSADSLRSMRFYSAHNQTNNCDTNELAAFKLNACANDEQLMLHANNNNQQAGNTIEHSKHANNKRTHQHQQQVNSTTSRRKEEKHEKRLIMLDVDPCCPKHGIQATNRRQNSTLAPDFVVKQKQPANGTKLLMSAAAKANRTLHL